MVTVATKRFGEISIDESKVIVMKGGICGFEHLKRYILLVQDENIPLRWLQSLDDGSVAFVVVNPLIVKPDYRPAVNEMDCEFLEINDDEVAMLSIITIHSQPFGLSTNLRAPIIINVEKKLASQVILQDPAYPIQYDCTNADVWGGCVPTCGMTTGISCPVPAV